MMKNSGNELAQVLENKERGLENELKTNSFLVPSARRFVQIGRSKEQELRKTNSRLMGRQARPENDNPSASALLKSSFRRAFARGPGRGEKA